MLITVLFCTVGVAFAGDGKGYEYPRPRISFEEEVKEKPNVCPPGSNGVYPNCGEYLPPIEKPKVCPSPMVGTFPNCILPPCAPGFNGIFPNCKKVIKEQPKNCPPPTFGTFPNCITPPCPSGYTGTYPDCKKPVKEEREYLPPLPSSQLRSSQLRSSAQLPTSEKCTLDWESFKTTFNKTYADRNEELNRQQSFAQNQEIIATHNVLYEQGLESYSLCMNTFGDWSHDEYLKINGIDLSKQPLTDEEAEESDDENGGHTSNSGHGNNGSNGGNGNSGSEKNKQAPDSKDWRKEGAVTPVKYQSTCASCWAFSAAGALEGQFFLKNGVLNSLSEQQLVDCCTGKYANNGCNTGFMTNAFLYTRAEGIQTEEAYPYEAIDNKCRASPNDKKNKKFKNIPKGDEGKLKEAVGVVGPVAIGIDATSEKFMFYSDGVYFNPDCQPDRISHAILAIGYDVDEETGMDYWIIKNSYGTSWGEGGYGKIARNKNNHCGVTNLASYPIL